jgi:hypothetical protein
MVHLSHHPQKINQLRETMHAHARRALNQDVGSNTSSGVYQSLWGGGTGSGEGGPGNGVGGNGTASSWYWNVSGFVSDVNGILRSGTEEEGEEDEGVGNERALGETKKTQETVAGNNRKAAAKKKEEQFKSCRGVR